MNRVLCAVLALLVTAAVASAQPMLNRHDVDFAGWTGTAIDGEIVGRDFDRYELQGVAGNTLTIRLNTPHTGTYFNVYTPGNGPGDEALANSSLIGGPVLDLNEFSGTLPETGVYEVVVYMVRAAARRDEVAPYSIEFDMLQPTDADDPDAALRYFQVRTRARGGHLNVHTGPSTDAPRVGRYDNGAVLRDIGGCAQNGGREWCEVMAYDGGLAGYVAREFLAPVSRHHGAAPVTPPRRGSALPQTPATPTRAGITTTSDWFHVHLTNPGGHLNVHAEPSAASVRVGRLPDGADLRNVGGCVASGGRTWCDVMQAGGGVSGWVAAEYLRDGHPPAAALTTRSGAPRPVTNDFADGMAGGPDWWQVDLNRSGSALRVHTRPSTHAPILARFPNGATLRNAGGCRMSEGRRWCYVSSVSGDATGWVAGDFLREGAAPGVASHLPSPVPQAPVAPAAPAAPADPAPQDFGPSYDMTGTLTCYADRDASAAECSYGTVHEGSGNGFLQITEGGYGGRAISFEAGVPVYFDQSQADGDISMIVAQQGDLWIVSIGEARFEIPVALFQPHRDMGAAVQLPLAPPPMEEDATVPGTNFNATTQIPCVRDMDAAEAMCDAGVVRNGDGTGYIDISWPDGGGRVIYFEGNTPHHYDEAQADGGAQMTVSRDENDNFVVFVGQARFVIPSALITGG
ncbi:SH3 domain-containing protein [Roseibacterium beibuensis]|uniref:SH3b domain-containing protein n=1 Tax=[Roseibacterium] beibuensis TaxID=1193142 RepID=A0ABP9L2C5_9RHOB|nr:SH3 domain-containing protein [Roseibacterium beibuensis]MCS6621702.1 SH3 domain-containing protein [Roseibacterium beibuensis]